MGNLMPDTFAQMHKNSDSLTSPTSILSSNISIDSSKPSSQFGVQMSRDHCRVGLGGVLDSSKNNNIVFGSQIKEIFFVANDTVVNRDTLVIPPQVNGWASQLNNISLDIRPGKGILEGLSVSEIELSEDYTCIIAHGPNPKTTHIFGDCILECHTNGFCSFGMKKCQRTKTPQVAQEDSTPYLSAFCYYCKKILQQRKPIFMYRDRKFCSVECRIEVAGEEMERSVNNSSQSSPEPSYHEGLFTIGIACR